MKLRDLKPFVVVLSLAFTPLLGCAVPHEKCQRGEPGCVEGARCTMDENQYCSSDADFYCQCEGPRDGDFCESGEGYLSEGACMVG